MPVCSPTCPSLSSSSDLIDMNAPDSLQKLSDILSSVRDTALELHESFEKRGESPLLAFERFILPSNRRFSDEHRAFLLWHLLLFSQPRIQSQKAFQNAISAKFPDANASIVVRQLQCRPPRAWSFRHSYQRSFAHTIAGPNSHFEISIDACLSATGDALDVEHLYTYGWTITYDDKIYLISACQLSQEQIYAIESFRPFPLQLNEDDFWEEACIPLMRTICEQYQVVTTSPSEQAALTDYTPEKRYDRLQRILRSTLASNIVLSSGALHTKVAKCSAEEILSAVQTLVDANLNTREQTPLHDTLRHRLLEAIGCDDKGNMPAAHDALLAADPIGLLLLSPDHPMFNTLTPRDSIRAALQYEEKNGLSEATEAFKIYRQERRWLAAFPCFDFSCEQHAACFGIPAEAIAEVFSPKLFDAKLPITPQGDVLRQLQNKLGLYKDDGDFPRFRTVLEAITSRTFLRNNNMVNIAQWLFQCCSRWRYCLCEISPESVPKQRVISQSNQQLLQRGLKNLSDMFRKK